MTWKPTIFISILVMSYVVGIGFYRDNGKWKLLHYNRVYLEVIEA